MPSARLNQLPKPSIRRTGWPWTEESQQLPERMPDGSQWPRISIVTPSFNQGQFLEETIRSVLLQGYPNLEYIVIDGGSTDRSVQIIRKYEAWLAGWESRPDRGQSHAINKGWKQATGDILGWLNSDDRYAPLALQKVATMFIRHPDAVMSFGDCEAIDENGVPLGIKKMQDFDLRQLLLGKQMGQPAVFVGRLAAKKVGFLDEKLQWAMDTEYFLRFWLSYKPDRIHYLPKTLANSRVYAETKTRANFDRVLAEREHILKRLFSSVDPESSILLLRNKALSEHHWRQALYELGEKDARQAARNFYLACRTEPTVFSMKLVRFALRQLFRPFPIASNYPFRR